MAQTHLQEFTYMLFTPSYLYSFILSFLSLLILQ